jgi:hypothetical protein
MPVGDDQLQEDEATLAQARIAREPPRGRSPCSDVSDRRIRLRARAARWRRPRRCDAPAPGRLVPVSAAAAWAAASSVALISWVRCRDSSSSAASSRADGRAANGLRTGLSHQDREAGRPFTTNLLLLGAARDIRRPRATRPLSANVSQTCQSTFRRTSSVQWPRPVSAGQGHCRRSRLSESNR